MLGTFQELSFALRRFCESQFLMARTSARRVRDAQLFRSVFSHQSVQSPAMEDDERHHLSRES